MKIEIFFFALAAFPGCWIANAADIAAESTSSFSLQSAGAVFILSGASSHGFV
jgi:hypothetical protein